LIPAYTREPSRLCFGQLYAGKLPRLPFQQRRVIGPSVNLVSRIEAVAKSLDYRSTFE
jgi:class 3 adenylate cyclase